MNIILIDEKTVRLTSNTGRVREKQTGRQYIEVVTKPLHICFYEDGEDDQFTPVPIDEKIPQEVETVFGKVLDMILTVAIKYDAIDDIRSMENVNIENLFALAARKGVSEADMNGLISSIVLLKTDIEAKFRHSWYDIWNVYLKKYIMERIVQMG